MLHSSAVPDSLEPKSERVRGKMMVSPSVAQMTPTPPRYFPRTISQGRTGAVIRSSKVRLRFSSANSRIERNGATNRVMTPMTSQSWTTMPSVRFLKSAYSGGSRAQP